MLPMNLRWSGQGSKVTVMRATPRQINSPMKDGKPPDTLKVRFL